MNSVVKTVAFWTVIVVSAMLLWQTVRTGSVSTVPEISYTDFLSRVASGHVSRVTIAGSVVRGSDANGINFRVVVPASQAAMLDALQQHGVEVWFKEATEQGWPSGILNLAPLILLAALWFFMIRQQRLRTQGNQSSSYMPSQDSKPRFGP